MKAVTEAGGVDATCGVYLLVEETEEDGDHQTLWRRKREGDEKFSFLLHKNQFHQQLLLIFSLE